MSAPVDSLERQARAQAARGIHALADVNPEHATAWLALAVRIVLPIADDPAVPPCAAEVASWEA